MIHLYRSTSIATARIAKLALVMTTIATPAYATGLGESNWLQAEINTPTIDTPTVSQFADGIDMEVVRATDNTMWVGLNGHLGVPVPGNGTTPSAPAVIRFNGGNLGLAFHHGFNNQIFYQTVKETPITSSSQPAITWNGAWVAIPNNVTTAVTPAVTTVGNMLVLVYTGLNQQLWEITYDGTKWSNAVNVPGGAVTTHSPAVTTITTGSQGTSGKLFVAYLDAHNDIQYTIQSSDGSITGWHPIPGNGTSDSRPTAVAYGPANRYVDVAIRGIDNQVLWQELDTTTNTWSAGWSVATGNMLTPSAPNLWRISLNGQDQVRLAIRGTDNLAYAKLLNARPLTTATTTSASAH